MIILAIKPKPFANLFNERGFTLLEMLLAFSIFCVIVAFIPLSFQYLFQSKPIEKRVQSMEWEVFLSQFKKELRTSDDINVINEKIVLQKNNQLISYEKYGTNLRRRVDQAGHEIVLQKVKSLSIKRIKNGVDLTVTDLFDQTHSAPVRLFLDVGKEE
ncbi:competence type IV pilus minor pilin ComGF [Bacillus sp. 03113]|uniref:competence type IV pilus minor pilin ComGF n=1 Tax=Bacillus sp. 03113 TaxID=2578211 RepID=UPI00114265E0|nr:competence type IV pilus minor pilin ComGF [Bacillus sp. 03113]